jgi:hypothetical protein
MMFITVGTASKHAVGATDLAWDALAMDELATMAATPTLLGGAQTYRLQGALQSERGEDFLDLAEALVASPHTFIFEEEKLLKKPTDVLIKAGATIEVKPVEKKKEASFDMFSLAGIFGMRDRKGLWLALVKSRRAGAAPEAVAGMMHWKARDMLAKGSTKYTRAELHELSRNLVTLYHDSHQGMGELDLLLERFVLRL